MEALSRKEKIMKQIGLKTSKFDKSPIQYK